jgi:N-dimethylarginine dimethylaminohydrolase
MKPKVLFSTLPKSHWWGKGTPAYENNWAMKKGIIPNQEKVVQEHTSCFKTLALHTTLDVEQFPHHYDSPTLYKHDLIFVRDAFVSNQRGQVVISNFREKERQPEAEYMQEVLKKKGLKRLFLPHSAYAEGGEFYYSLKDDILFAGTSRNNKKGVLETARLLNIKTVCIIESDSFHLDTLFTIVLNKAGHIQAVIACLNLIHNKQYVKRFLRKHHIALLAIDPIDTIGYDGEGKISVNCLAVPGKLIGGSIFHTRGIEEQLAQMDITHIISPISQFLYSGGGVHCLTNELFYEPNQTITNN